MMLYLQLGQEDKLYTLSAKYNLKQHI